MESRRDITALDLCGGDLALDFVNTLGGLRDGPWDDEWLGDYDDLVSWSVHAGALTAPEADRLRAYAASHGAAARAAHAGAVALREQLHRVVAAIAQRQAPPPDDLAAVTARFADSLSRARLEPTHARLDWAWDAEADLERPLWPVLRAAVDLLRSDRLPRLKQCGTCRWVFLDSSRNASRRWCSMAHCGSGAKVRRTRERRTARRGAR